MIINPTLYQQGTKLPELSNPGTAADLLAGKQLVDQYGNPLTGTMPQRSAADLTASGAAVTVPAGYYPSQVSKSVATATHPKPTISRSGGTITAKHVQSAGYTSGGTTTETLSIPTQAAKTVTPTTYAQTAVSSGRLTTGAVTVAGDANLKAENIKSGVSIFGINGNMSGATKFYKNSSETMNIVSVDLPNSFTVARNGQEDTGVFQLGYLQSHPSMGISVGASGLGFFEINGSGVFFGQSLDKGALIFIDASVVASGLRITFSEEITSFVGLEYIGGFIWKR